jgi:hypothetical protein
MEVERLNAHIKQFTGKTYASPVLAIPDLLEEALRYQSVLTLAEFALSQPYPSERAYEDKDRAKHRLAVIKDLVDKCISHEVNDGLKDAQTISALTLKAALAGAFTPPKE